MTIDRLRRLIESFILDLFQGSELVLPEPDGFPQTSRLAAQPSGKPNSYLIVKKDVTDQKPDRFLISRSQGFRASEIKQIGRLVELCIAYDDSVGEFESHREAIFERLIAEIFSIGNPGMMQRILAFFSYQQSRTYEGRRVSSCILLHEASWPITRGEVSFGEIAGHDLSLVLSDGQNTALCLDGSGMVVGHVAVEDFIGAAAAVRYLALDVTRRYYPQAFKTVSIASDYGVIVLVSTQGGDTLIFRNGSIACAKRRGYWTLFDHEKIISMMTLSIPNRWNKDVRASIYETALDVSLAHSGGLLVLLARESEARITELIYENDILGNYGETKLKTRFFNSYSGKSFHQIDRRIRKEISSIDGAVVLDHLGHVVAIGAILRAPEPSDSGARLAAARRAARFGLAVKISTDGLVSGFGVLGGDRITEVFRFG